jgi:hypothetical protein
MLVAAAVTGNGTGVTEAITHATDEHHLILIILVLLCVVILISTGKGLGTLVNALIKKIFGAGKEVTVNINEQGEAVTAKEGVKICKFSPDQCMEHRAEYERSKRNQDDIRSLKTEFGEFKTAFFRKLETIESGVNDIKVSLAGTMAELNTRLAKGDKF